jgi:hypothetical protein
MAAITARPVLVALMLALLLALTTPAAGSDSAFAAAAVKSRQSSASSSGGSSGGGGSNPSGSGGKTGKSKGKGKGGALTEWASKLRGQMPGKFDDKAAKKIFDRASASAVEGGKKLKPTVDEYKAKGWHYQMKPEVIPAAPDGGASSAPTGHPAGFPYQNAAGAPPGAPGTPGGPPLGATRTKLNKSPKMDVTDPETIQKDQGKYEKTVEWKERMEAARKVRACVLACAPEHAAKSQGVCYWILEYVLDLTVRLASPCLVWLVRVCSPGEDEDRKGRQGQGQVQGDKRAVGA